MTKKKYINPQNEILSNLQNEILNQYLLSKKKYIKSFIFLQVTIYFNDCFWFIKLIICFGIVHFSKLSFCKPDNYFRISMS